MTGYDAYKYYLAVKLHFTTDKFDVFRTYKVRYSQQAYEKRRDRLLFEKLAHRYPVDRDLIRYYVSNFAYGNNNVVYEEEESSNCYIKWVKNKESITKLFEDDLNKIILYAQIGKLKRADVLDTMPSVILQLYIGGHISIESTRILDDYLDIVEQWKQSPVYKLWESDIRRLSKLKRFVKYNDTRIKPIVESFLGELDEL